MLDIKFIRENADLVRRNNLNKNVDADVDVLLELDGKKRALRAQLEEINRERNEAARAHDVERGRSLKQRLAESEKDMSAIDAGLNNLLAKIPNIASDDTPIGPDESGNVVLKKVGELPAFDFSPKDHIELGASLDLIDTESAARVAGTRFAYLKGDLALLQHALASYALAELTNAAVLRSILDQRCLDLPATPFVPIVPPLFIRPDVFQKMARLEPRDERYYIPADDLYLIGSAEHTLGPLHMDETLPENALPLRYVAFTPAFRREAGSYGKDTRGIIRVHQFEKMEIESFSLPEFSRAEQDFFVAVQEHIVGSLGLPYQTVQICTGDMGGPDARQIDLETWLPGQGRYRETHTSDFMTDYQARRLNTRVKRAGGENQFVHMNDATVFAGRTLVAVMENYQRADGTIRVPDVLVPHMGGRTVIGKKINLN